MTTNKDFSKLPKKSGAQKAKNNGEREIIDHLSRLIKLLITLNNGVLNLNQAAQECGVSKRTMNRDIKILEKAGIPLYKPNEQNSNYRLRPDFELSKFLVTEKNARDFADMLDVITQAVGKNNPFVLPIQKEVIKAGKQAQKKRQTQWEKVYPRAADELFAVTFLDLESMKSNPWETMFLTLSAQGLFDKKEKAHIYNKWHKEQTFRVGARFDWLQRKYNSALFFCDALIKEYPEDPWAYRQAALVCYTKKDYPSAQKYIADGLKQNPQDEVLPVYRIYLEIAQQHYENALRLFKQIQSDTYLQTHFCVAMYDFAGEFEKALSVAEAAIKAHPKDARYPKLKARLLALNEEIKTVK